MMMQKAAEMMFAIPLAKRQIADLESAIEQGAKAQRFVTLLNSQLPGVNDQETDYSLLWLLTNLLPFRTTRTLRIRGGNMEIT